MNIYDRLVSVNFRCLSLVQFLKVNENDSEGVIQRSVDGVSHMDKMLLRS